MGNLISLIIIMSMVLVFTGFPHWARPALALGIKPSLSSPTIQLNPIITDSLEQPVFLTVTGRDAQRLYVVEQRGRIRIIDKGILLPHAFLDISEKVGFGGERGLLGLAFHPQYKSNGRFFVNYTRARDGATVVSEFTVSTNPLSASSSGEHILLVIPQPYGNHNGGMIAFGPDGFLYIGMGDGGAGGDPGNRGQNPRELLGKMLRIDIDQGSPFTIPDDNPFAKEAQGQAIYALGFRNPWRFSFDRQSGELWVGDVGQNQWEEIDRVERGKNYGWRLMEGLHCFKPSTNCSPLDLALPLAEYKNASPRCSITGGYVYRGHEVPGLSGQYVFADFCSGEIMRLVDTHIDVLLNTGLHISSFGEDKEGELFVVDHGGGIYKITTPSRTR
ncbi:MAG: PQQ-dependent sugar dehydrogenase [Nitrospirota bacterium]|nr:PQQ-dependent sugar dehydrogenase [Nitrospirota bacterium]